MTSSPVDAAEGAIADAPEKNDAQPPKKQKKKKKRNRKRRRRQSVKPTAGRRRRRRRISTSKTKENIADISSKPPPASRMKRRGKKKRRHTVVTARRESTERLISMMQVAEMRQQVGLSGVGGAEETGDEKGAGAVAAATMGRKGLQRAATFRVEQPLAHTKSPTMMLHMNAAAPVVGGGSSGSGSGSCRSSGGVVVIVGGGGGDGSRRRRSSLPAIHGVDLDQNQALPRASRRASVSSEAGPTDAAFLAMLGEQRSETAATPRPLVAMGAKPRVGAPGATHRRARKGKKKRYKNRI